MFNLFKSQEKIIQEIHDEFDSAEDRLLKKADEFIANLKIPTETQIENKAERLQRVGFTNANVVKRAKNISAERDKMSKSLVKNQEQAELIKYYKQTYPFNKFLTEDELDRICEKYGLIYAPASRYTMDVPEKNLKEIESAVSLKGNDMVQSYWSYKPKSENIKKDCPDEIKEIFKRGIRMDGSNDHWAAERNFRRETGKELNEFVRWLGSDYTSERIQKDGLFIAAPQSNFDLKGLDRKTKHGFFSVSINEVKDPIVFRYVRGGIQVITKWGLEASDELLLNEINN